MKAAVRSRYGPPDVLSVQDIEKPVPKGGEVLVRVNQAAACLEGAYYAATGLTQINPRAGQKALVYIEHW